MFANNFGGEWWCGGREMVIFEYVLKCQDCLLSSSPILLSAHSITSGYIEVNATVEVPEGLSY